MYNLDRPEVLLKRVKSIYMASHLPSDVTKPYDYVILGAGAAGLSLAYHMVQSPLSDRRILIVDREEKNRNDRTWCFWSRRTEVFEPIYFHSWPQLSVIHWKERLDLDLGDYTYHMIRGADYYRFILSELKKYANVTFIQGEIEAVNQDADGVTVVVEGREHRGGWGFDSTFSFSSWKPQPQRYHYLWQHFKGWVIETDRAIFDPGQGTLFDFRTPQDGAMRFMYVLPWSTNQALVEYTLFSAALLDDQAYDEALRMYLQEVLRVQGYRILEQERGIIPMTDHPFARRVGHRILNIGTKGGLVKPSSGYAFMRIQADSAAIVRSLITRGHPFALSRVPRRFHVFDRIMLQVMSRHGDRMADIFMQLFRNNPAWRIFRFLDEQASWGECLQVLASLPPGPFLQALWRVYIAQRL
ncbi:lycopene cyclase family protein [Thermanaerothrix sp. 4228-RoL]|uniref:Lycopene cyclase family protein n=1 Tax=Thermanaerothrix solaris TaxID=3058434 RepID=A0ABU3NL25_9CHLR|nr:lycopene cyclase family protein [Thermanaerothrix sp. 4228-RoL]MDT8897519.1 lycopene cyclase family protein [Thermanaerothrix sp. 4228-RoL]